MLAQSTSKPSILGPIADSKRPTHNRCCYPLSSPSALKYNCSMAASHLHIMCVCHHDCHKTSQVIHLKVSIHVRLSQASVVLEHNLKGKAQGGRIVAWSTLVPHVKHQPLLSNPWVL